MEGDCKHAAILIGNLMELYNISYYYYFVKLGGSLFPNHVVIVVKGRFGDDFVIDPFMNLHIQEGIFTREVHGACYRLDEYHQRLAE